MSYMTSFSLTQEFVLLNDAIRTVSCLNLNLNDSVSLTKAAKIICTTICDIENIFGCTSLGKKNELHHNLFFAMFCRAIITNIEEASEDENLLSVTYVLPPIEWNLLMECMQNLSWETYLLEDWKKVLPAYQLKIANAVLLFTQLNEKLKNVKLLSSTFCAVLEHLNVLEDNMIHTLTDGISTLQSLFKKYCISGTDSDPFLLHYLIKCTTATLRRVYRLKKCEDTVDTNELNAIKNLVQLLLDTFFNEIEHANKKNTDHNYKDNSLNFNIDENQMYEVKMECFTCLNLILNDQCNIDQELYDRIKLFFNFFQSNIMNIDEKSQLNQDIISVNTRNQFLKDSWKRILEEKKLANRDVLNCIKRNTDLIDYQDASKIIAFYHEKKEFTTADSYSEIVNTAFQTWSMENKFLFINNYFTMFGLDDDTFLKENPHQILTLFFNSLILKTDSKHHALMTLADSFLSCGPQLVLKQLFLHGITSRHYQFVVDIVKECVSTCNLKVDGKSTVMLKILKELISSEENNSTYEEGTLGLFMELLQNDKIMSAITYEEIINDCIVPYVLNRDLEIRLIKLTKIILESVKNSASFNIQLNHITLFLNEIVDCVLKPSLLEMNHGLLLKRELIISILKLLNALYLENKVTRDDWNYLISKVSEVHPQILKYLLSSEQEMYYFIDNLDISLTYILWFCCCSDGHTKVGYSSLINCLKTYNNPYWHLLECLAEIMPLLIKEEWQVLVIVLQACFQGVPEMFPSITKQQVDSKPTLQTFIILVDCLVYLSIKFCDINEDTFIYIIDKFIQSTKKIVEDESPISASLLLMFNNCCFLLDTLPETLQSYLKPLCFKLISFINSENKSLYKIMLISAKEVKNSNDLVDLLHSLSSKS